MNLPIERHELHIRKWPLYFIAAVFVVFVIVLDRTGRLGDIGSMLAAGGLVVFSILYFMLSKNKLIVDNDGITQQLFFGKQKVILWKNLVSSSFHWHYHGHGASLQWEFCGIDGKKIILQSSFYSRSSLRLLADALMDKRGEIVLDKRIKRMAENDFPWYIF